MPLEFDLTTILLYRTKCITQLKRKIQGKDFKLSRKEFVKYFKRYLVKKKCRGRRGGKKGKKGKKSKGKKGVKGE